MMQHGRFWGTALLRTERRNETRNVRAHMQRKIEDRGKAENFSRTTHRPMRIGGSIPGLG
jgi:hypothetical protein